MSSHFDLSEHLPLIAIIRGVEPDDVLSVANVLIEEGFSMIEVPLNSPNALESIKRLVSEFGSKLLLGAGTVTTEAQAQQVIDTGANLIVAPNCNEGVIKLSVDNGCATFPGVVTTSEAFCAIQSGATGLKLFPVSMVGLQGLAAIKSILPTDVKLYPVGGIEPTEQSMGPYIDKGVAGFGLGSSLYKPSMTLEQIRHNARRFVECYSACIKKSA